MTKEKGGHSTHRFFSLNEKHFDLLVPQFKDSDESMIGDFQIDKDCKEKFCGIFNKMTPATFLLQSCASYTNKWTLEEYNTLNAQFVKKDEALTDTKYSYDDYNVLLSSLHQGVAAKQQITNGIRQLCETEPNEDIVHFKHIEVNLTPNETSVLQNKIKSVKNSGTYTQEQILKRATKPNGEIDFAKAAELQGGGKKIDTFKSDNGQLLNIAKIAEHYYLPLQYAESDKIGFITHVIKENSEKDFIEKLITFLGSNKIECDWMFPKIDESVDQIFIPYSDGAIRRRFFPDFVFWQKSKGSDDYKITFVDPKSTQNTSYQLKVDGFERLFLENGKPKTFVFQKGEKIFNITVDLKLVKSNNEHIPKGYEKWWVDNGDFSWLLTAKS